MYLTINITNFKYVFSITLVVLNLFLDEDLCKVMCPKRLKTDVQNYNYVSRCQMPDLIRDAYDFDEDCTKDSPSFLLSSATYFKE